MMHFNITSRSPLDLGCLPGFLRADPVSAQHGQHTYGLRPLASRYHASNCEEVDNARAKSARMSDSPQAPHVKRPAPIYTPRRQSRRTPSFPQSFICTKWSPQYHRHPQSLWVPFCSALSMTPAYSRPAMISPNMFIKAKDIIKDMSSLRYTLYVYKDLTAHLLLSESPASLSVLINNDNTYVRSFHYSETVWIYPKYFERWKPP